MISFSALAAALATGCAVFACGDLALDRAERKPATAAEAAIRRRNKRLRGLFGRLTAPTAPGDLAALVDAAGAPGGFSAKELMGAKLVGATGGLLLGLIAAAVSPGGRMTLLVVTLPVASFLIPDLLLRRRAGHRRRLLEAELPIISDRILLAIRAGLPLGRALAGAAEHGRGLLAVELGRADALTRLGSSRAEALVQLERRCPLPEVVALVAAIRRADRYGAALEPILAALAAGARVDQQRRITERAQSAAPKIQLIVALLLVPAAICCVAAGMIAGLGGS